MRLDDVAQVHFLDAWNFDAYAGIGLAFLKTPPRAVA
jgi:hypothetical protein